MCSCITKNIDLHNTLDLSRILIIVYNQNKELLLKKIITLIQLVLCHSLKWMSPYFMISNVEVDVGVMANVVHSIMVVIIILSQSFKIKKFTTKSRIIERQHKKKINKSSKAYNNKYYRCSNERILSTYSLYVRPIVYQTLSWTLQRFNKNKKKLT